MIWIHLTTTQWLSATRDKSLVGMLSRVPITLSELPFGLKAPNKWPLLSGNTWPLYTSHCAYYRLPTHVWHFISIFYLKVMLHFHEPLSFTISFLQSFSQFVKDFSSHPVFCTPLTLASSSFLSTSLIILLLLSLFLLCLLFTLVFCSVPVSLCSESVAVCSSGLKPLERGTTQHGRILHSSVFNYRQTHATSHRKSLPIFVFHHIPLYPLQNLSSSPVWW